MLRLINRENVISSHNNMECFGTIPEHDYELLAVIQIFVWLCLSLWCVTIQVSNQTLNFQQNL